MPHLLSGFLKASAATLPLLVTVIPTYGQDLPSIAPSFQNSNLPLDQNLIDEARFYLFADMQTLYGVSDEILSGYLNEIRDQDFLETKFKFTQFIWQNNLAAIHPDLPYQDVLHRLQTDDLFLAETLIAAAEEYDAKDWENTPAFYTAGPDQLSQQDKASHLIGLFVEQSTYTYRLKNPFGFYNVGETDGLSQRNPYVPVTEDQLASYKTVTSDKESPTILMLPPSPSSYNNTPSRKAFEYETMAQWQAGHDVLSALGANVIVLDAEKTNGGIRLSGDLEMFVRDEGLVFPDIKVAFYPWRVVEHILHKKENLMDEAEEFYPMVAGPYQEALLKDGYELLPLYTTTLGGDFQVYPQRRFAMLADNGEDNIDEIVRRMEDKTGYEILVVPKIRNETFYHLDTFAMVLPHGEVMIYPYATTQSFMQELENRIGADNIIPLSITDARLMATNLLAVGDTLVMPGATPELIETLKARGYTPLVPDMLSENNISFYSHQRGFLHCQTQEISYNFSP